MSNIDFYFLYCYIAQLSFVLLYSYIAHLIFEEYFKTFKSSGFFIRSFVFTPKGFWEMVYSFYMFILPVFPTGGQASHRFDSVDG